MALVREAMVTNMKLLGRWGGIRSMSAGTVPKMKVYDGSADADAAATQGREPSNNNNNNKVIKGNYVPIYVALGMIGFAVALGVHTAKQQFMHAPAVRVKKSRREVVSEVVDPEHVANESQDFINKSFFRKVANVQEFDTPVHDPIHGNTLTTTTREPHVESLKTVGVNPVKAGDTGS